MDPTGPRKQLGTAPEPGGGPDPGQGCKAHREHLTEEELPRDTRMYLLAPVEYAGPEKKSG